MKSYLILCTILSAFIFSITPHVDAAKGGKGGTGGGDKCSIKGNGFPKGAHYNLNIIGVSKGKTASMTGSNGHTIFVSERGKSTINLEEGSSFRVLDRNATDGSATFQLPNPDPDNDGVTEYSVFARPLGKPGGKAQIYTCATDVITGELVCSTLSYVAVREKGSSCAKNVSKELLYIYADLDGDGIEERYNLFNEALQDYFWEYDNNGLKLLQLRFYELSTNVN